MFGQLFSRDPSATRAGLRAASFLGRLVPNPGSRSAVPDGFVALSMAVARVLECAGEWNLQLGWTHVHLRKVLAALIGDAAASGRTRLVGMDASSGKSMWILADVWRMTLTYGGKMMSPADAAFHGKLVRLQPHGAAVCVPIISLRDLAVLLGASEPPPPPPSWVLDSIHEPARNGATGIPAGAVGNGAGSAWIGGSATDETSKTHRDPWDTNTRELAKTGNDAGAGPDRDDSRGQLTIATVPSGLVAPDPTGTVRLANTDEHKGQPEQATAGCLSDNALFTVGNATDVERDHCDLNEGCPTSTGAKWDAAPAGTLTYRTGAPGHPTSKQLVEDQMRRRASSGLMCGSLTKEADVLAAWLPKAHPLAARMISKSIRNQLCDVYRELNSSRISRPK